MIYVHRRDSSETLHIINKFRVNHVYILTVIALSHLLPPFSLLQITLATQALQLSPNFTIEIIETDITAANGVLHKIKHVILP